MNLFRKEVINHFEKEVEIENQDQYQEMSYSEERISNRTDKQEKELYYPNPALFRRLIEGTSFDRRIRVEPEQQINKTEDGQRAAIPPKNSIVFKNTPLFQKSHQKKETTDKSGKRKKFINKERENKLGHLVHDVLGYPEKKKD